MRRLSLTAVLLAIACQVPTHPGDPNSPANETPSSSNGNPGSGSSPSSGFPEGCAASAIEPAGGPGCTASCVDCGCTSIKYVCDASCYTASGSTCLINADSSGAARPGPGLSNGCGKLSCTPENDLSKELTCVATQCNPPPVTPPPAATCPSGSMPAPGTYGTRYECYGIESQTGNVFSLDKLGRKASLICTAPASLGPIEAFAISPITGNAFIIAQDTSDFGKFIPKDGTALCAVTPMGKFPSASIGGFGFSLDGMLYAGEEGSGRLWRFRKDAKTGDPIAEWDLIGAVPTTSEGIAFNPKDGLLYNSSGSVLNVVDPKSPGTSLFACSLGSGGYESIFFDKDGVLYSTNNSTNEFTSITVDRVAGTCTTKVLFSVLPATELEASDCNLGCAYDSCVCK